MFIFFLQFLAVSTNMPPKTFHNPDKPCPIPIKTPESTCPAQSTTCNHCAGTPIRTFFLIPSTQNSTLKLSCRLDLNNPLSYWYCHCPLGSVLPLQPATPNDKSRAMSLSPALKLPSRVTLPCQLLVISSHDRFSVVFRTPDTMHCNTILCFFDIL